MATKFGHLFQRKLKHYVLFRRKIERELRHAIRLFKIPKNKSPLEIQVITLADLMLEINQVVTDCFKRGQLSSGLHQLRLAQEVAHKMFAMYHKPSLAKKKKVSASEVRDVLEKEGFPNWKQFYNELSIISHHYSDFVFKLYHQLRLGSPVTKEDTVFIGYYLMILNNFNMKALYVIFKCLKPHMGGDYSHLVETYNRLEASAKEQWKKASATAEAFYGVEESMGPT